MSHRVGAVVVSERDVWISFNSCFIFVLRKYIHKSTEFVQFLLNSAQFLFFFFGCFWLVAVFFFLLRLVLDRDQLVADWILLSAFSRLDWSGNIWSSCFLRLEIVSGSALEFFSCCWIRIWRKSCSDFWQILLNAILKCSSGLSGLGWYWRPTEQDFLSTKSLRTDSDRRLFARLVSSEAVLFLSWLKPSVC